MDSFIATDLEGTLTAAEGWKSVRKHFESIGRGGVFRRFFISQLPRVYAHRFGWLDTASVRNLWMRDMASIYRGWTESELAAAGDWLVETDLWPQRRAHVLDEIMRRHAAGSTVLIVSGLYEPILRSIAGRLAGERVEVLGTRLEMKAGRATGRIAGEVCGGENKIQRVKARIGAGRLAAAYGDTAGDVPMLAGSEAPVAVCPDDELARLARERGWRIMGDV
jgi:HAD superfamily phosphoserine phosphatase-like hydrolase